MHQKNVFQIAKESAIAAIAEAKASKPKQAAKDTAESDDSYHQHFTNLHSYIDKNSGSLTTHHAKKIEKMADELKQKALEIYHRKHDEKNGISDHKVKEFNGYERHTITNKDGVKLSVFKPNDPFKPIYAARAGATKFLLTGGHNIASVKVRHGAGDFLSLIHI